MSNHRDLSIATSPDNFRMMYSAVLQSFTPSFTSTSSLVSDLVIVGRPIERSWFQATETLRPACFSVSFVEILSQNFDKTMDWDVEVLSRNT